MTDISNIGFCKTTGNTSNPASISQEAI